MTVLFFDLENADQNELAKQSQISSMMKKGDAFSLNTIIVGMLQKNDEMKMERTCKNLKARMA